MLFVSKQRRAAITQCRLPITELFVSSIFVLGLRVERVFQPPSDLDRSCVHHGREDANVADLLSRQVLQRYLSVISAVSHLTV